MEMEGNGQRNGMEWMEWNGMEWNGMEQEWQMVEQHGERMEWKEMDGMEWNNGWGWSGLEMDGMEWMNG